MGPAFPYQIRGICYTGGHWNFHCILFRLTFIIVIIIAICYRYADVIELALYQVAVSAQKN
jgi:hypothetical protein